MALLKLLLCLVSQQCLGITHCTDFRRVRGRQRVCKERYGKELARSRKCSNRSVLRKTKVWKSTSENSPPWVTSGNPSNISRAVHVTTSASWSPHTQPDDSSQGESIAKKCVTHCFPLLFIILWLHVTELQPNFIQMGMNYRICWGLIEPKTHHEAGLPECSGIRKWNTSTLSSVSHLCSSLYVWFIFLSLFLWKFFLCFSDL